MRNKKLIYNWWAGSEVTTPNAPVALPASDLTTDGFTANWAASAGATSYRLDVSTVSNFASFVSGYEDLTVSGTSHAVSGLAPNTTYYYRLRAVNSAGTSDNSNTISEDTLPQPSEIGTAKVYDANVDGATGHTLVYDEVPEAGEMLVVWRYRNQANVTFNAPDETWTKVQEISIADTPNSALFYKIAGESEPNSYHFTSSGSAAIDQLIGMRFRDAGTIGNSDKSNNGAATVSSYQVTTDGIDVTEDSLVLAMIAGNNTITSPGWTNSFATTGSTSRMVVAKRTYNAAAAAQSTTASWADGTRRARGILVEILPAFFFDDAPIVEEPDPDDMQSLIAAALLTTSIVNIGDGETVLTRPNQNLKTKIPASGITIQGVNWETSIIKRPDDSVGDGWGTDSNFGVFFEPSEPTVSEISNAVWSDDMDGNGLYTIITRGDILLKDLTIDCNMGNQVNLYSGIPSELIEHSAMIGSAGRVYNVSVEGEPRRVYVGFESVSFENIRLINGGYADDLWCARGYFKPNIGTWNATNVQNISRVNNKRGSLTFSGLANEINILNCNLYKLESETASWDNYPPIADGTPVQVTMTNLTCNRLDWATKSQSSIVTGDNITSTESTYWFQCGGTIINSSFVIEQDSRFIDNFGPLQFTDCDWLVNGTNGDGTMKSIIPFGRNSDCLITFLRNTFTGKETIVGTEYLIFTENTNSYDVDIEFVDCDFDARFIAANRVARLRQSGSYLFQDCDGIDTDNVTLAGSYTGEISLTIETT